MSHVNNAGDIDSELDDAALWAVIDSAAAASIVASSASKIRKPLALQQASPVSLTKPSAQSKFYRSPRVHYNQTDGEVLQGPSAHENHRPQKIARSGKPCVSEFSERSPSHLVMVRHVPRTPTTPVVYSSPEIMKYAVTEVSSESSPNVSDFSPVTVPISREEIEKRSSGRHSLSGQFPTVSLFKEYQNSAMAILEKSDYTLISGSPYIKKTGWRKIAFYFNISFEIKDKSIEFDEQRNVQRAEFVVRAYMPGGRFADGWGSSERREKRFMKPNHDIPSTAETRAKNRACQDLLGIGEYRSGASHSAR